jgi:hypothetical protein
MWSEPTPEELRALLEQRTDMSENDIDRVVACFREGGERGRKRLTRPSETDRAFARRALANLRRRRA